ncbi:MAG: NHLP bacteriocin system secretion protein [Verrucomicrobiota bacterium]|jgi:HlyD family secretion protein
MEPTSSIFRKAALDKLSSPEQLDQLMQVTTPKSWIALAACVALVFTAMLWTIFGSIPSRVYGRGILVKEGGVFVATSRGEGNVQQIFVQPGDLVSSNQILAMVSQPELQLRIDQAQIANQRLEEEFKQLQEFHRLESEQEQADLSQQRGTFRDMIGDYGEQIRALEERIKIQEDSLLQKGLVSKAQLLETRNSLFQAQHELARTRIQLKQIDLFELQAKERRRQAQLEKQTELLRGKHQLDYLHALLALNTQIKSPYAGNVLEIMVKPGQLISANTPILSLQAEQKKLEAHLFLHPADGKLVAPGMNVAIAPASIRKEEFGFILARVESVSPFPATPQGMLRVLENQALVSEFSAGGAPIEVVASLQRDANTQSGFRWSTARGPDLQISSGTLCDGTITITNQRPITLVLPLMKKTIGM